MLSREPALRMSDPDQAREGEYDRIYRLEAPRLLRYFRKQARSGQDTLDLVHETFARLLGAAPRSSVRNPGAYLQRIARNLLIDRIRRAETEESADHVGIEEAGDIGVPAEQSLQTEAADVLRIYRRALAELPEKTRLVFVLHRVDECQRRTNSRPGGRSKTRPVTTMT